MRGTSGINVLRQIVYESLLGSTAGEGWRRPTNMNKSDDPDAPKNQQIARAPHGGQNQAGDIVADATESAGQGSDWEASGDISADSGSVLPGKIEASNEEGYSSGPETLVGTS